MPEYLVESPHSKEECLKVLDEIKQEQPEMLDRYRFGCMAGEHTGWITVEANNKAEARSILPDFLRDRARVVELNKFTPEQIESFHRM